MITDDEEEALPRFAPRFYNLAVRRLGYTHTEAGLRRLGQLMDELNDLIDLENEARDARESAPDAFWYMLNGRSEE